LQSLGYDAVITSDPETVLSAERAILPGVGAFGDCLKGLKETGLYEAVEKYIASGKPMLGICVGMQMLFEKGYEFGEHDGFGFFKGDIKKFPDKLIKKGMKIPHMGWNKLKIENPHPVLKDVEDGSFVYFVHSFYAHNDLESSLAASCEYGISFTAMAARDNVVATQFHPEKSQEIGLKILKNFAEWVL